MADFLSDDIHLYAPNWLDQAFGTGVVGSLSIGESLSLRLLKALDSLPETRDCGLRIGVVGRASKGGDPIRASAFIRAANNKQRTTALIYIGPRLSEPPIVPPVSNTHQLIAELFSTTLTCSMAVAGWVGTIATAGATGATGGLSVVATTYLASGAALATAQCTGSIAHSALYLADQSRANSMSENPVYKTFNTVSDAVNLAGIVFAGMDVLRARSVLRELGVSWSDAMSRNVAAEKVVTMRQLFELLDNANAETVAKQLQYRIFNVVAGAFGIYGSQRDENGVVNHLRVTVSSGNVVRSEDAPAAPSTATPGSAIAGRAIDDRLHYQPGKTATVSIAMMKTAQ